jgi:hypothetical protein
MSTWLEVLNSALIVGVGAGVGHVLIKIGALQTKIDTMWEWWTKNGKDH